MQNKKSSSPRAPDFSAISVRDLLEAREAYHVHLMHLDYVVGTAIGRYLIREKDPDASAPETERPRGAGGPRTLTNTVVKKWSWPSVLVFVRRWLPPEELHQHIDDMVPPRLYLPDGRVVPTCVVAVEDAVKAPPPIRDVAFAPHLLGGGYPLLTEVQGEERVSSVACLVSDGNHVYALTNQHVVGDDDRRDVYTVVNGERRRIGASYKRTAGKVLLADLYPGISDSTRTYATVDAGLVKVDRLDEWTAQVYGIGKLGNVVDMNAHTLTLDLIGRRVCAFGAASGPLSGQVKALFYRYRSIGGFDYVADFLIGPRDGGELPTRPGDSGTLWTLDEESGSAGNGLRDAGRRRFRPLAVQWGGERFLGGGDANRAGFALASSISGICRLLDVDVVVDWSTGHTEYWGKVGHYKIAAAACAQAKDARLHELLMANLDAISVADENIAQRRMPVASTKAFVALADVPDLVWRAKRQMDRANHFADMDQPDGSGKTLLDLWKDPRNRTPQRWTQFYDEVHQQGDSHRGALPFRVGEIFDAMVRSAREGDVAAFVCAAGIAAHYVGDACQPLHTSHLHDGSDESEQGVHSGYETLMLDARRVELIAGVNGWVAAHGDFQLPARPRNGAEAADALVGLIRSTIADLPPQSIIDAWNEAGRKPTVMWKAVKEKTFSVMGRGTLWLARLWEAAWEAGGGAAIDHELLAPVPKDELQRLYLDKSFLESRWLRDMQWPPAPADVQRGAAPPPAPPRRRTARGGQRRRRGHNGERPHA